MIAKLKNHAVELTEKALLINEKLHVQVQAFISQLQTTSDTELKELNKQLSYLVRKERLYLGAAKSLLQKI